MADQSTRAFDGVIYPPVAGRLSKPRHTGQTMVIDKGLTLAQIGDLLELAAPYIDLMRS
jgi:phosphosulfolactate synthase